MPCDQGLPSQQEPIGEVYRFCLARAEERILIQRSHPGMDTRLIGETEIDLLREFRREIIDRPWASTDGLDFFCTYAMRNRHHPDDRPEWASA